MPPPKGPKVSTYKQIGGKIVKPILYVGRFGKYIAGEISGEILIENSGRPIPYSQIYGDKPVN